jgi:hypothetical protein
MSESNKSDASCFSEEWDRNVYSEGVHVEHELEVCYRIRHIVSPRTLRSSGHKCGTVNHL